MNAVVDAALHRAERGGDHWAARRGRGLTRGGRVVQREQRLAQRLVEALGRLELDEVADAFDHRDLEAGRVLAVDLDRGGLPLRIDGADRRAHRLHRGRFVERREALEQTDGDLRTRRAHAAGDPLDELGVGAGHEHPWHRHRAGAGPVFAVGLAHLVDLLALHAHLDVLESVDHDDARDGGAEPARRFERHRSSHRVSDQHDVIETELAHHGGDVVAVLRDGPGGACAGGLTVAGQVERHHGVVGGEHGDLLAPVVAVAGPAMDEHQRRSRALNRERDLGAVGERHAPRRRTVLGSGRRVREQEHRRQTPNQYPFLHGQDSSSERARVAPRREEVRAPRPAGPRAGLGRSCSVARFLLDSRLGRSFP